MDSASKYSERGHANFLTGSPHLLDIPMPSLVKHLLQEKLPRNFLPSFLHEATHYWCMATDLGASIALLEMRSHHVVSAEHVDGKRVLHDVGVVQIIRQLLDPLLEGMALFQEFDALPGESDVKSTPGFWAGLVFRPLDEVVPELQSPNEIQKWATEQIVSTLAAYRVSKAARQRKTGVLMRSLSNDPHHYLSGYLSVKNLWINAIQSTPAFCDKDLFLSFLHDWIFQDWVLIDYMLDESLNCGAFAYLASERLQARLVALSTDDLSREVQIFNREIGEGTRDSAKLLESYRLEHYEVDDGQEKLEELLDEIHRGIKEEGENQNWYLADFLTLEHRQRMVRLGLERVQIEVNEHDRVLIRKYENLESTYFAASAPDGAERGTTPGWVAAYFLPHDRSMMVFAVRDNQPMICFPPIDGTRDQAEMDRKKALPLAVTKVISSEENRRRFTALGLEVAESYADEDYQTTMATLSSHVREIYTNYALCTLPDRKALPKVEALLSRKGLYDVLLKDGDTLTALVEISLLPSGILDEDTRPLLAEVLEEQDIQLDRALALIDKCQIENGFPLLIPLGGAMFCTV